MRSGAAVRRLATSHGPRDIPATGPSAGPTGRVRLRPDLRRLSRRPSSVLLVTWAYSCRTFAIALPTKRVEAILYGMRAAFEFFGCVPKEVRWDNRTPRAIRAYRRKRDNLFCPGKTSIAVWCISLKRMGRDSNPRCSFPQSSFQDYRRFDASTWSAERSGNRAGERGA